MAGTWRQELVWWPWKKGAFWNAPHCWLSLVPYSTWGGQPRQGRPHQQEAGPTTSIKKMYSRLAHKASILSADVTSFPVTLICVKLT